MLKEFIKPFLEGKANEVCEELFCGEAAEFIENNSFPWELGLYDDVDKFFAALKTENIQIKLVSHHGGEGQGDEYYNVYSFEKDNEKIFVKFHGYWQSYSGAEYHGWNFCKETQKTIKVYE